MSGNGLLTLPPELSGRVELMSMPECDSTSSCLKRLAPELRGDTVLIASRQTGGRGRMGRSFYSPEGSGLYMSILTRPDLSPADLPLLTPAAAVAVCGAIEELTDRRAEIKWVNDILIGGKKVCGILTESALGPGGEALYCVVGIGVNLSPPRGGFPEDIADTAGSVLTEYRPDLLPKLAFSIIKRFYELLPDVSSLGFLPEYRSRSALPGRDIWIIRDGSVLPARAVGIDDRCGLQVRYPDGAFETLRSGEVTVRVRQS